MGWVVFDWKETCLCIRKRLQGRGKWACLKGQLCQFWEAQTTGYEDGLEVGWIMPVEKSWRRVEANDVYIGEFGMEVFM